MFEGMSIGEILMLGHGTLIILIGASVLSVMVILLKFYEFWNKSKVTRSEFVESVLQYLRKRDIDGAIKYSNSVDSPMAPVAKAGLLAHKSKEGTLNEAMEREIMIQTVALERFITILGTIGSIAVYIGLFGTVLGIMDAFSHIAAAGSGGISVVIKGVSVALVCTATGLAVAIPAVIVYNFLTKLVDKFVVNMEYCASAVEDFLSGK